MHFCCRLGLHLQEGDLQCILNRSYIFIHTLGGCLSHGGLCAVNGGEVKVDWEPWPSSKHQIMWTIPCNCGVGGIIGMHYFSQMWWPVSFFVFSQLPNHLHYCLVQSLHQPFSLWVVGHGPQLLHAKDLALFINYTTQVSTSVTQEPGWGSKDGDVTLVHKFSNGFCSLIGGHTCQHVLHEVVLEHQDISNSRWLVWLQNGLYAGEVNM